MADFFGHIIAFTEAGSLRGSGAKTRPILKIKFDYANEDNVRCETRVWKSVSKWTLPCWHSSRNNAYIP